MVPLVPLLTGSVTVLYTDWTFISYNGKYDFSKGLPAAVGVVIDLLVPVLFVGTANGDKDRRHFNYSLHIV